MVTVKPYTIEDKLLWNNFISLSKNGTFLLDRNYMTYHADRFEDASLLFFDKNQSLIALLPANKSGSEIISHEGLTYGGLIYDNRMTQPLMIHVFQVLLRYLLEQKITGLTYKTIPAIYHKGPSDEDRYVLFLLNAQLIRRDSLTVIDKHYPIAFQKRRKRALNQAQKSCFKLQIATNFVDYWNVLIENLQAKHGVKPVHHYNEIQSLAENFPSNIKLFTCYEENTLMAGVVIYETELVAHFQYIAATEKGKNSSALDWLFMTLITDIYKDKRYIDFGISNEKKGRFINQGLIDFKEGFGGRTIVHDYYQIKPNVDHISQLGCALL